MQRRGKSGTNRAAKIIRPNRLNNVRNFVCAASLLLAVWLGLTFVSKVPANRYPSLGKGSVSLSQKDTPVAPGLSVVIESAETGPASVPVAR